ncbi:hypothetical protein C8F04DRAFT_1192340 [Mycena alexandri]|uniref:Uncharacterized protein n=1 Tax=Mycena alexandri TaxID=1745969 RepID=A0AAD6SB00_9AGAR|nr:hypothetical protein C8F04DRAFT_1192340 [Mycena alexandri]
MNRLLAALNTSSVLKLGPDRKLSSNCTVQFYNNDTKSSDPLAFTIFGVLRAVIDRGNKPKELQILLLETPDASAKILNHIFERQIKILEDVVLDESAESVKRITNKELWSQGPALSHSGTVYVRISAETHISTRIASGRASSNFDIISTEIPIKTNTTESLELGSLILCIVHLFRADIPITQSTGPNQICARTIEANNCKSGDATSGKCEVLSRLGSGRLELWPGTGIHSINNSQYTSANISASEA